MKLRKLLRNKRGMVNPALVLGIVITSIVAFIALMVGIMVVQQADTAAGSIIPDSGTANTTYEALLTAIWNAFGLYNIYPIVLAAIGIIAIIGLLAFRTSGT